MPISVSCPSCGTKMKAPDNAVGKKVKCPKCANLITVTAEDDEMSAVSAALPPPPEPEAASDVPEEVEEMDEVSAAGSEAEPDEADEIDEGGKKKKKPGGPTTEDEKLWGMLAHLAGLFFGVLGALIVWLIKKKESRFLDHQGKEELNFQLTMLPLYLLFSFGYCCGGCFTWFLPYIVQLGLHGLATLLILAVTAVRLIFGVMAALAAKKGEWYVFPFAIRLIK
jgi:uncharacterized protein